MSHQKRRRLSAAKLGAVLLFIFFAISTLSGCATRKIDLNPRESAALVGKTFASRFQLPNGLRVVVVEDHSSPTLAYQTWYRVGSKNEEIKKTGLAHLFEHMMFKGTKNYAEGEFDKLLESAGAEGENAFTNHDQTVYVQEMPSSRLELIVKLESDRMQNLVVDETSFKTEVEVVQNERRFRNENNPDGLIHQTLYEMVYQKHPYRWPVIGYETDLKAMKSTDALDFYKRFYQPDRAIVVIVGDVDTAKTIDLINRYYGPLARTARVEPYAKIDEPRSLKPRRRSLKLNIQVQKLMMGYLATPSMHKDTPALMVLEDLLASGKSSRLSKALVDSGIATYAAAYHHQNEDDSIFAIDVGLQKGRGAAQAEQVALQEIRKLQNDKVSEAELKRAKNRILFSFYSSLDSNAERAEFIGKYEAVSGDFRNGLKRVQELDAVTADDVKRVANRYLIANSRSVVIGVPK